MGIFNKLSSLFPALAAKRKAKKAQSARRKMQDKLRHMINVMLSLDRYKCPHAPVGTQARLHYSRSRVNASKRTGHTATISRRMFA